MDRRMKSKLELALVTPDAISIWNKVVRETNLIFRLNYTSHTPTLWVRLGESEMHRWFEIDTRKMHISKFPILDLELRIALTHLESELEKIGMCIAVQYTKRSQKKQVSLRLRSITGGPMTTVLDTINKGQFREYHDFKLTDNW